MQQLAEWTAMMMGASEGTAALIGCSPAAVVAQAAHETDWGRSAIGNNLFGIKADEQWQGVRVLRRTWEVFNGKSVSIEAWFRDYPTLADGIADHFAFLRDNGRYAAAGVFDPNDSKSDLEYFQALARGGYATDPNYAERLSDMLDSVHMFTPYMVASDQTAQVKPVPRLLLIGSDGVDVRELQSALQARGFYRDAIDGDFGPQTRKAVLAFQAENPACGDVDGIVGDKTRAVLGL